MPYCATLPALEAGQALNHIYMHWRVSTYFGDCLDYNILVKDTGKRFIAEIETDPLLNATEPPQAGYAAHTAGRNGQAIGVSVDAMMSAEPGNFGQYPPTLQETEVMLAAVGACGHKYGLDLADHSVCMTHAEAAILDGYFPGDPAVAGNPLSGPPYRWDWALFNAGVLSKDTARECGNTLRQRAHNYKLRFTLPA